jgi:hypothetical protein
MTKCAHQCVLCEVLEQEIRRLREMVDNANNYAAFAFTCAGAEIADLKAQIESYQKASLREAF